MDLSNDNIIHVKKNGIEYLQFRILQKFGITNCYTTRINNFDLNTKLEKEIIELNFRKLCDCLNIDRDTIMRPKQTHTDVVKRVDKIR